MAAARRAFNGPWSKFKPAERQQLLLQLAEIVEHNFDELAALDTLDMGGPIKRTLGGRPRVVGLLRCYAGQATAIHGETIENSLPGSYVSFTLKEPVGVVGGIIPWNGPLGLACGKIGGALATGCTLVLKPAEQMPLTALRLAERRHPSWRCQQWFPGMVKLPARHSLPTWTWTRWHSRARTSPDRR